MNKTAPCLLAILLGAQPGLAQTAATPAEPAPPPAKPAMRLPDGSVAVPVSVVLGLLAFTSDRHGLVEQLHDGLEQASQIRPQACPAPEQPKAAQ